MVLPSSQERESRRTLCWAGLLLQGCCTGLWLGGSLSTQHQELLSALPVQLSASSWFQMSLVCPCTALSLEAHCSLGDFLFITHDCSSSVSSSPPPPILKPGFKQPLCFCWYPHLHACRWLSPPQGPLVMQAGHKELDAPSHLTQVSFVTWRQVQ